MKLNIDFGEKLRPIGRQNGTNNGPLMCFTDRTKEFRDMGVSCVRFHETHSYNTKCIEVPFIFRDFDADENDEKNYFFAETDAVIRTAVEAGGIEIIYRLGMGTEGTEPKIFTAVPKDFAKWARIAEHIVKHYNEGWANGFHYNIRYWEIWNEANLRGYWPSDDTDSYGDFYAVVSRHLKKTCPKILVGCTGWSRLAITCPDDYSQALFEQQKPRHDAIVNHTLELVKQGKAILDFFSWHTYSPLSVNTERVMQGILEKLGEFGLEKTELVNTEWASFHLKKHFVNGKIVGARWDFTQPYIFDRAVSLIGSLIVMQHYGNAMAAYYDADERSKFCGLFDFDGTPKYQYYSLKSWKPLLEAGTEVFSSGETETLRVCAAAGNGKKVILLSNEGEAARLTLALAGVPAGTKYTVRLFDPDRAFAPWKKGSVSPTARLGFTLPAQSAALVEIEE